MVGADGNVIQGGVGYPQVNGAAGMMNTSPMVGPMGVATANQIGTVGVATAAQGCGDPCANTGVPLQQGCAPCANNGLAAQGNKWFIPG